MSRERLFAAFFFAVFLVLLWQLCLFLRPFVTPLIWAGILALTFYPLTRWLVRAFRGNRGLTALVLVVVVTVGAIMPAMLLGSMMVRQAAKAYVHVRTMAESGQIQQTFEQLRSSRVGALWDRFAGPFAEQIQFDPQTVIVSAANWISQQLVGKTTALAGNVLGTIVDFTLMLVALFFFFRDGERMAGALRDLIPMEGAHKQRIFARLSDTLTAVVQSMILVAVAQGILGWFAYWAIGDISFSLFLGFLTAVASFVPVTGSAIVWGGAAIVLAVTGYWGRALGLVAWGMFAIGTADNVIRTALIGERAKLPTFLVLFGVLGGMNVYGFLGIFLAPVILAILLAFVDIYRELYQDPIPSPLAPATDERRLASR